MVFPVVMYGCESWTIKKAEHWRIHAFKLWCRRRLLRVPWTVRRSNQSILKEINPRIFIGRTNAEAPVLWPPDTKSQLIRKDPDAGKDWRQEEKMMRWLDHITDLMDMSLSKPPGVGEGQRSLACCRPWGRKESSPTPQFKRHDWVTELNWVPQSGMDPSSESTKSLPLDHQGIPLFKFLL